MSHLVIISNPLEMGSFLAKASCIVGLGFGVNTARRNEFHLSLVVRIILPNIMADVTNNAKMIMKAWISLR